MQYVARWLVQNMDKVYKRTNITWRTFSNNYDWLELYQILSAQKVVGGVTGPACSIFHDFGCSQEI